MSTHILTMEPNRRIELRSPGYDAGASPQCLIGKMNWWGYWDLNPEAEATPSQGAAFTNFAISPIALVCLPGLEPGELSDLSRATLPICPEAR